MIHPKIAEVTQRIVERSQASRQAYLARVEKAKSEERQRMHLSCSNLAHGFAACSAADKGKMKEGKTANFAIINSYNDMLSAHQPYHDYPDRLRKAAEDVGVTVQVAGGVPAMCDGVTQGQPGMELSLFSRDLIAMATAMSLSHDMFDGAMYLGVCDKIVPGLVIGALSFGHLPSIFVPAGPMPSGLPNAEKAKVRQDFAAGKATKVELLEAESASYHSAGTCTFYGTANSNQMLMEIMGMHLPGSSFVNPGTALRGELTKEAVRQLAEITEKENLTPIADILTEKAFVNGMIGLLATGGSTNHTLHLMAMARAGGIQLSWQDMADLSDVIPLLCRVYPNGLADVNHFHKAGGMGFLMRELLNAGLLHADVKTVMGDKGLEPYTEAPSLQNGRVAWHQIPEQSGDEAILAPVEKAFSAEGGLKLLAGNLGRSVIKTSAVKPEHRFVKAPALIFHSQEDFQTRFKAGEMEKDFIAVVRFQGPKANGMPELHKLTPPLGVLQDKGFKVALVTDGRMSGASGKVPAAIHLTPEAKDGGMIAKIREGDMLELDAESGQLTLLVDEAELAKREAVVVDLSENEFGMGRELFAPFRKLAGSAESGAGVFFPELGS